MEKRIIFISNIELWSLGTNKGGRAQISTVRGYVDAGWEVIYVSSAGTLPPDMDGKVHFVYKSFPLIDKLSFIKFKPLHVFKYIKILALYLYYTKEVKHILRSTPRVPTIIYAYEVDAVKAGRKIATSFQLPLVIRFQGTVHTDTKDSLISTIRFAPHLTALKTPADLVIMTNDGTKGNSVLHRLKNPSNKIFFWMNGVDKVEDEEIAKRDKYRNDYDFSNYFVFLTVSRLEGWKKVDRAIRAFKDVAKTVDNVRLHIIGDGSSRVELENLSKELQIEDKVIFHGAIEQNLVRRYMIASDCFMSLYDLSNVGNPLLEAMSCGKPIITLNNGDTSQYIINNFSGVILDMNHLDRIPEEMLRIINDDYFASMIAQNAREYAQREFWSWDQRIMTEIIEVSKLLPLE